jgi:hypothetical protein
VKTTAAPTRTVSLDTIVTAAFTAHLYILCAAGCLFSVLVALRTVA